jgi:hypothetical protein
MKIRPVEAELFLADRRTDMMKLIITFRNFANLPKIVNIVRHSEIRNITTEIMMLQKLIFLWF